MTRRSRLWLVAAVVYTVVNVGGAILALIDAELMHAAVHVGLLALGAWFALRTPRGAGRQQASNTFQTDARLEQLQQSVDAIALEVERIGEAQRFITKIAAERVERS